MTHEENDIIITDINESLRKALTSDEKAFYDTLSSQQRRDYFLHMGKTDRRTLMRGNLSKEDEALMWTYASTLALRIYNQGFGISQRVKVIRSIGRAALVVACIVGLSGIFTSTYLKNTAIHSHMKAQDNNKNKGADNE